MLIAKRNLIKLSSTKADLLSGLVLNRNEADADKEWLILANGAMVKQVFGWSVSDTLQMDWTPAYSYVEFYINGDYRGFYILCESVKQGNISDSDQSRCQVDDDGFVVELDAYWWNEDLYFITPHINKTPMHYTFKYPDFDDIDENSDEYKYIKNYFTEFENALLKDDDSYLNYIDYESFTKWLLAQDIFGSYDSGGTNIFITKKDSTEDSKLIMGPLWDFDSVLNRNNPYSFSGIRTVDFFYFNILLEKSEFLDIYKTLFNEIKENIIPDFVNKLDVLEGEFYDYLLEIENLRWDTNNLSFEQQGLQIVQWLEEHIDWLKNKLCSSEYY